MLTPTRMPVNCSSKAVAAYDALNLDCDYDEMMPNFSRLYLFFSVAASAVAEIVFRLVCVPVDKIGTAEEADGGAVVLVVILGFIGLKSVLCGVAYAADDG
eukprot:scaffold13772_cov154-Skeletonema_dohrnii-CCMP3373.AAC.10